MNFICEEYQVSCSMTSFKRPNPFFIFYLSRYLFSRMTRERKKEKKTRACKTICFFFSIDMPDNEYIYEIITNENDARCAAQLIAEEFSAYNPITCFDRISSEQFYRYCSWPIMQRTWSEGLSMLARQQSNGEIIAATIAGDLYLQHQSESSQGASAIAVDDLLNEMDHVFISKDFGQELRMNLVLHVTLGAVRNAHAGKGIASEMRKLICENARDRRGFEYLLVQTTSPATRHIYLNKMNGKEVTIVDPTTWMWKNSDDQITYPYQNYQGGLIPNILVKL